MVSTRAVILATATMASAQSTTLISAPYSPSATPSTSYTPEMPTLPNGYYGSSSTASSSSSAVVDQYGSAPTSYYTMTTTTTTSVPYTNEFTIYLSQTNSMGVVTGMPTVVTSQPLPITSQASAATLPAGVYETSSVAVPPATTMTTSRVYETPAQNATRTTTNPVASHTGAASGLEIKGSSMALVIAGLAFGLF